MIVQCSACYELTNEPKRHELLLVPICENCYGHYHCGSFDIDEESGNEIYCRWCGQGEGQLFLCDNCPKSFCERCLGNNFGLQEVQRVKNMNDRWRCVLCSPQILKDLIQKNGWDLIEFQPDTRRQPRKTVLNEKRKPIISLTESANVVCPDISRGRENFEIPVINEFDDEPAPLDFVYITQPVVSHGVKINNNPDFLICCSCTDNCRDSTKCECAIASDGLAYDLDGRLISDKIAGIYECNYKCKCHVKKCKNRVVGRGPRIKLEIFRCSNPKKGWGVRCKEDIKAGTFIADYLGEILPESIVEKRGLEKCDQYLFNMDAWGRDKANLKIASLGLKKNVHERPREYFMDASLMNIDSLKHFLDDSLLEKLTTSGAIKRAQESLLTLNAEASSSTMYCQETSGGKKNSKKNHHNRRIGSNNNHQQKKYMNKQHVPENATTTGGTSAAAMVNANPNVLSVFEKHLKKKMKLEDEAISIINDRCINEVEENNETFVVDARWYGSVGRFLNHSCRGNVDKISVFCEFQDVRMPRIAFFASEDIPANTEISYDYGYLPGNVDGKHHECFCGTEFCRKILY